MALPKEIQRQIDEADILQKELIEGKTANAEPTEPKKAEVVDIEHKKEKEIESTKVDDDFLKPSDTDTESEKNTEKKLRKEVGHANKRLNDFKKLHDDSVTTYKATIARLESENESLTTKLSNRPSGPSDKSGDTDIIREAREDYGDDAIDALIRTLQSEVKPVEPKKVEPVKAEQHDSGKVEETKPNVSRDVFSYLAAYDSQIDWPKLNGHAGFNAYLNSADEYNRPRRDMLNQAFSQGRHIDVAQFFINFVAIDKKQREADTEKVDPSVMPDSSSGGDGSPIPEGRLFTWDEYQAIKTDISKGRYSPEEAAALNLELEGANQEGRIQ